MAGVWGSVLSVVKRLLTTPTVVTTVKKVVKESNVTRRVAKKMRKLGHDLDPNHTVDWDFPPPLPPNKYNGMTAEDIIRAFQKRIQDEQRARDLLRRDIYGDPYIT